jgi:hypothetical protein
VRKYANGFKECVKNVVAALLAVVKRVNKVINL